MNGIILLDKPAGYTSRQCINRVTGLTKTNKAGHVGTLDPFATGILPICLGKATRIAEYLVDSSKSYSAALRFGVSTDTLDIYGCIATMQYQPSMIPINRIEEVMKKFIGIYNQKIPKFSASKINGKRSYKMARADRLIPDRYKQTEIYDLKLTGYNFPVIEFSVKCSKGTYIRALGTDIAEILGTVAVLTSLRRTEYAHFSLNDTCSFKMLKYAHGTSQIEKYILPIDAGLRGFDKAIVANNGLIKFRHGQLMAASDYIQLPKQLFPEKHISVYTEDNKFIGIGALIRSEKKDEVILKTVKLIDIHS